MHKFLPVLLLPFIGGCAYLHDRSRDACDMVTLAVETLTVNASVQVGKAVLGLGAGGGRGFGLRSGALGYQGENANILEVPNAKWRHADKTDEPSRGRYVASRRPHRCRSFK